MSSAVKPRRRKSNVASLFGSSPIGQPTADPDVIAKLSELLQQAKDGHLIGISYAMVDSAGNYGTGWVGKADSHRMEASVGRLFFRLYSEP